MSSRAPQSSTEVPFTYEKGQVSSSFDSDSSEFIKSEMDFLVPRFLKIAEQLKYGGKIRFSHTDRDGVVASQASSGNEAVEGLYIEGARTKSPSQILEVI